MAESQNNRSYFNSEASKNRDQWKHGDGLSNGYDKKTDSLNLNMYATGKFDDVIRYNQPDWIWKKADGDEAEYEDEEYTEYENEAGEIPEEEFTDEELPKFRHLVRAKKLEFKAQYGKAHLKTWTTSERKCLGGLRDVKGDGKPPFWDPNINCTNINVPHIAWVWGWRKKWREFKQQGGLAQLKMQSKGMAPIPGYTEPANTGTGSGTGSGTGTSQKPPKPDPKLDIEDTGTSKAGISGNIIGVVLLLGVVFGVMKFNK